MRTNIFNYKLPKKLIAQIPIRPRDHSRLLVLRRKTGKITHDRFFNIGKYLRKGDLLVLNDSKVIPARLWCRVLHRKGKLGRKIEVLLLKEISSNTWQCLLRGRKIETDFPRFCRGSRCGGGRLKINDLSAEVIKHNSDGIWEVKFNKSGPELKKALFKYGQTPLPPYIKPKSYKLQAKSYQTIYAKREGSVAAPTAGFHFTRRLLKKLKKQGIETVFTTLHVGLGTFLPIKEGVVEKHKMHSENFVINKKSVSMINKAREEGRRVIAVGTTSARVLESSVKKISAPSPLSRKKFDLSPVSRETKLFIKPGYKFKAVDGLITNFHLSKTTLLLLVSAFASRDLIFRAYKKAIKKGYRFYSFGDAMFIY